MTIDEMIEEMKVYRDAYGGDTPVLIKSQESIHQEAFLTHERLHKLHNSTSYAKTDKALSGGESCLIIIE